MAVGVCTVAIAACEQDRRVPYIPPTLANWPQPYRGVAGLKVHVFNTGYLRATEALVLQGGSVTRTRDLPVPALLIEHPMQGLILFNTGLNAKITDASPHSWLSQLVGPEVLPGKDLKTQMQQAGLKPESVRWIVLSNLRFDHTGEVEAFSNARVVVTQSEHRYAQQEPTGYLPREFDDVANWKFIDFDGTEPLATFLAHVDLFGDGSCLLLDARGTTPGAMAMLVRLPHQPLLLADGLATVAESVRYAAMPASAFDRDQWWTGIWRLKKFKDLVPDLIVAPGHDLQPLQEAHTPDIVVHAFSPAPGTTPTPDAVRQLIPRPM